MRLMKMLGLATIAAPTAMAFVGATSASAASTQLCSTHTALTCSSAATSVSAANQVGPGVLLSNIVNILCLTIEGAGTPLGLANPQSVHITSLTFENCGTKAGHSNCEITVLSLPLFNLNKTGLDTGTLTGTNGETLVECENIDIFGIDIHCVYGTTGLQFSVGAQHITANEPEVEIVEGGFFCPEESFLDGLLLTAANRYVLA